MAEIVYVQTDNAIKKLRRIENKIIKQGYASANDLKELGKRAAQTLVPKGKTGWLFRSIKGRTKKEGADSTAQIFLEPTIVPVDGVHRYSKGNYPNFNLSRWMHTSPRAKTYVKNGDHKFMYTTRKILEGMGVEKVKASYGSLKLN